LQKLQPQPTAERQTLHLNLSQREPSHIHIPRPSRQRELREVERKAQDALDAATAA